MARQPTVVSLFAGIGGFDLGFEQEGFRITHVVEFDEKCQQVLAARFPEAKVLGDIAQVHGKDLLDEGMVPDVVVGGFPCQDISIAGRREGLSGDRSGLWFEFHRILSELRAVDGKGARWVIIENVAGLLSSHKGRDLGTVLGALGDLGLGWAYRVVDSQYVGCCWEHAGDGGWGHRGGDDGVPGERPVHSDRSRRAVPQRRRRIFIVGCAASGWRGAAEVLLEPEGLPGDPPTRVAKGQEPARALGTGAAGHDRAGSPGGSDEASAGGRGEGAPGVPGRVLDPRDGVANALTMNGLGGGGADDNLAQAAHVIPQETVAMQVDGDEVASTLRGFGHGWQGQHNTTNAVVQDAQEAEEGPWAPDQEEIQALGSAYTLRMREGAPGGGKGPLVSEDVSLTLATGNDQTVFAPDVAQPLRSNPHNNSDAAMEASMHVVVATPEEEPSELMDLSEDYS